MIQPIEMDDRIQVNKYTKVPGSRLKAEDAQEIGELLYSVAEGDLNRAQTSTEFKDAIVEAASDEDSVLHKYFTWNDDLAAQKQRRTEAAYLVRSLEAEITYYKIEEVDGEENTIEVNTTVKALESVNTGNNVYVYKTASAIFQDAGLKDSTFYKLYVYLLGAYNKFNTFAEVADDLAGLEAIVIKIAEKAGLTRGEARASIQRIRRGV